MDERNRQKMTERLPRLGEHLLDQLGALLLFVIVASTVGGSPLGVMVVVMLTTQLTVVGVVWRCWGRRAAVKTSLAAIPVMVFAGPFACGVLAAIAYYAVPLWYLDATPGQRVRDVVDFIDGPKRTLREVLGRIFKRA